jgi:hypothetical protein
MKTNIFKTLLAATMVFVATTASACWYKYTQYNDYIYGINNFINHTMVSDNGSDVTFMVQNNQIVDLPCSVSINLEQNSVLAEGEDPKLETTHVICKLQYRVLPSGNWIDVAEREFEQGTIPVDALPAFYLGRNNINPQGLKEGDVIMIRLYVQRGPYTSGVEEDLCESRLVGNKFQNNYQYTLKEDVDKTTEYDLGGGWLPHRVTTVIFSGKYRPVR